MAGYPYRTLFGWIAALALAWLALSSPWTKAWNLLLAGIVILLALAASIAATRRVHARLRASRAILEAIHASLDALPGDIRRNTPLVLAVGEGTPALVFGEQLVRISDSAIWVRVGEPTRLAYVADEIKRWREGQGPDAVACLVGADQARDSAMLNSGLRHWRAAIGEASRAVGYPLPACVAVYVEEAGGPPDECPWLASLAQVCSWAKRCALSWPIAWRSIPGLPCRPTAPRACGAPPASMRLPDGRLAPCCRHCGRRGWTRGEAGPRFTWRPSA